MGTSQILLNAFLNPHHIGDASEPNFTGHSASFSCGAVARISINIDDSQHVTEAKFRAAGCSVMVAAASMLTESVKGKTTADAARIAQQFQMTGVAADRSECTSLVSNALLAAIAQYSDSIRDTWEGDEALICTCFGVSERTIENEIETKRLTTIDEVTRACNAGAGCRSCYPLIEELLQVKREG